SAAIAALNAMICRSSQPATDNASQYCRRAWLLEFPIAIWLRHPYTLGVKRKLLSAPVLWLQAHNGGMGNS
ncbi:MAG: hypothetical protein MO846_11950, partial [Candidatus Devosia symbiotica]|nr:hypothetical protein [Candidatus Devosia symbiotica]